MGSPLIPAEVIDAVRAAQAAVTAANSADTDPSDRTAWWLAVAAANDQLGEAFTAVARAVWSAEYVGELDGQSAEVLGSAAVAAATMREDRAHRARTHAARHTAGSAA